MTYTWTDNVPDDTVASQIRNNLMYLKNSLAPFKGCRCTISAVQSIANSTWTAINWTDEDFDTDNFHDTSTNKSRITIPAGISKVVFTAGWDWTPNVGGNRSHSIKKNGTTFLVTSLNGLAGGGYSCGTLTTGPMTVEANDYFELRVFQSSGGSLNFGLASDGFQFNFFAMQVLE
jgi:hypothetical protein